MKTIALLCGGKSPEHEISVRSAKNILAAIDRQKFKVILIGIDRRGCWRLQKEAQLTEEVPAQGPLLALTPGREKGQIIRLDTQSPIEQPDAIFAILHGPQGEDGTMQGLLRILDLPFVGPDVLGSAASMDKDVAKRLMREAGINVAPGQVYFACEKEKINYEDISARFGNPVFIKPANMGSSVGVHKASNAQKFAAAVTDAFLYDRKIIIEGMLHGREIECAVLGNDRPEASGVGEVITPEEYSYEAKYSGASEAQVIIPANVSEAESAKLRAVALKAYQTMCCEGMARVDMFLTAKGKVYVNEINTLPGFTSISMYPKLWLEAGLSYPDLIERLIELAIERHAAQKGLKTGRL